jgi:hypothetical protein
MVQIVIKEPDGIRQRFTEACALIGTGGARQSFSRTLNHEGAKALTAVRRALVEQTSLPRAGVVARTKFKGSSPATLIAFILGEGRPLPISYFAPKAFSYGVRVKLWGRFQVLRGAFVAYERGQAFKRIGPERGPIRGMYGPGIANELVKDQSKKAFEEALPSIYTRAVYDLARMLAVR